MRRILMSGAVFALLAAAVPVQASDLWQGPRGLSKQEPGKLYVGVGVSGGLYTLPKFEIFTIGPNVFPPPNGHLTYDPKVFAGGPGASLGYVFPEGTFPSWMGRKVRLALSGSFWLGETSDRDDRANPVSFAIVPIDGTLNTSFGFASGFASELETEFRAFEIALRASSDFAISPTLSVTPSVGIFGGRSTEKYFLSYRLAPNLATSSGGSVNERNGSTRIGGDIGADLTYRATQSLTFHLGGRVGVFHIRTRLRGRDCRGTGLAQGGDCDTSPNITIQTSVTDRDSSVSFRGIVNGGATFDTGWAIFSLGGFFTFETAVPGINNPTPIWVPSGGGFTLTAPQPARVRFDDGISYGAYLTVRVPLQLP